MSLPATATAIAVRVTILTPTLDAERYLAHCLRSVREQTYPRELVEHLVLDGGSNDSTVALAREAGAQVQVHVERDGSAYAALNRGVRLARGDVIGWLNADDTFAPGALCAVADAFARTPDAEIVVGDYEMGTPGAARRVRARADALARLRAGKRTGTWVTPLAVFFRAATLRGLGDYLATHRVASDFDLWVRAAARDPLPRVVHAGAVLGTFRVHAGSLSTEAALDRSLSELVELAGRWAKDGAAPAGVRRFGLFAYRRHVYLRRSWDARGRGVLARLRAAIECHRALRPLGPGALLDMFTSMHPW